MRVVVTSWRSVPRWLVAPVWVGALCALAARGAFAQPPALDSVPPCQPIVYCEDWQTTAIRNYSRANGSQLGKVRALLDTLDFPIMQVPRIGRINTYFKPSHQGWDIDLDLGDTVRVAANGRVRFLGFDRSGYGTSIVVRHPSGIETLYAHLSRVLVAVGQDVEAGYPIGLGGSTGRSTGPHLHFEVRLHDVALDPLRFIGRSMGMTNIDTTAPIIDTTPQATRSSRASRAKRAATGRQMARIRPGDTLGHIALRYGTTVARLEKLNRLKPGQTIRAGRSLRVR